MKVRAIDSDGDWVFGKGKNDYKKDIDALKQIITTRIKSWKRDCFFAPNDGVDYKNFLDRNTKTFLDNDIKRVILQTDGVLRINTYESEINENTREIEIESNILSIYGTFNFNIGG